MPWSLNIRNDWKSWNIGQSYPRNLGYPRGCRFRTVRLDCGGRPTLRQEDVTRAWGPGEPRMKRPRSRRARAGPYRWSCLPSGRCVLLVGRLAVAAVRGRLVVPAGDRAAVLAVAFVLDLRLVGVGDRRFHGAGFAHVEVFTPSTRSFFVAGGF